MVSGSYLVVPILLRSARGIGKTAHRGLRVLACNAFHFDIGGAPAEMNSSVTRRSQRVARPSLSGGGNLPASATEVTNCAWTFMVFLAVNFIASGAKALAYCA